MSSLVGNMPGPVRSPHHQAIGQLYEHCGTYISHSPYRTWLLGEHLGDF